MAKKASGATGGGRGGGLCCDHCADTKYPCALWEKRMRGEEKGLTDPLPEKNETTPAGTEERP